MQSLQPRMNFAVDLAEYQSPGQPETAAAGAPEANGTLYIADSETKVKRGREYYVNLVFLCIMFA